MSVYEETRTHRTTQAHHEKEGTRHCSVDYTNTGSGYTTQILTSISDDKSGKDLERNVSVFVSLCI